MVIPEEQTRFGVYVHWPFCAAKCPYCDFNSHVRHDPVDQQAFAQAYSREIAYMGALAPGRTVSSIFFGGGTPSLMHPATLEGILSAISECWNVDSRAEISLEANPSSVDATRFTDYRSLGVNRVSLGVQSLRDDQLRFLGRLHNVAEAKAAIDTARSQFDNMSFDLIYARPGQTMDAWKDELQEAISLAADHLSLYQLTIEQETAFFDLHQRGKFTMPEEETAANLYEVTQEVMNAAGFSTYETSNHARPGAECRHNLVYWRGQEYAGIGAGAHGRLRTNEGRLATATEKHPEKWVELVNKQGHGICEQVILDSVEQADELLLMGMRLAEGFDPARYEELCGQKLNPEKINFLQEIGMITVGTNNRIRTTQSGMLVLDAVVADLASFAPEFAHANEAI